MEAAFDVAENRSKQGEWSSPLQRAVNFDEEDYEDEVTLCVEADHEKDIREATGTGFLLEQLFTSPGTLPAPMEPSEREAVIRGVHPTATYEMLSKIPNEILEHDSQEGHNLRLKLLTGATIVFVTAGYPGKRFAYETAARLGVKSVIIDNPDSWARCLVDEGVIAKFIPIDMSQHSDTIFFQALEAVKSLEAEPLTGSADGLCTFVELSVPLVARLAEALALPGSPPASVDVARDKYKTRTMLQEVGLPSVRNHLISSEEDLEVAAAKVGFPAVLKPISGAASLGVKKVDCKEDLLEIYREIVELLDELVISSGALERVVKMSPSSPQVADPKEPSEASPSPLASPSSISQEEGEKEQVSKSASSKISTLLLMEEYLDGQEVDVDIILSRGKCTYAEMHDNGPTVEPYFAETWGCMPSLLPEGQAKEMIDFLIDSTFALGFNEGVFHVEGKYTSRGPRLIEVNARMGGGPVWFLHKKRLGVDLVAEALLLSAGIPSVPFYNPKPPSSLGVSNVNALKSGFVSSLDFLKKFESFPGLVKFTSLVQPFEHIVGPEEGQPSWLMEVILERSTTEEASRDVQELDRLIGEAFAAQCQ